MAVVTKPDDGIGRGPCRECMKALPTHSRRLSGLRKKKKKSNWEGQPLGPWTTALLGRFVEWVGVVTLRGCRGRQGRNAVTILCFRKDQALAPVSSVALGLYTMSTHTPILSAERLPRLGISPELRRLVENLRSEQVPTHKL